MFWFCDGKMSTVERFFLFFNFPDWIKPCSSLSLFVMLILITKTITSGNVGLLHYMTMVAFFWYSPSNSWLILAATHLNESESFFVKCKHFTIIISLFPAWLLEGCLPNEKGMTFFSRFWKWKSRELSQKMLAPASLLLKMHQRQDQWEKMFFFSSFFQSLYYSQELKVRKVKTRCFKFSSEVFFALFFCLFQV